MRAISHSNAKSKSEKFPPPHQDGALGFPLGCSHHIDPPFDNSDTSFDTAVFPNQKGHTSTWSGPLTGASGSTRPRRKKSTHHHSFKAAP